MSDDICRGCEYEGKCYQVNCKRREDRDEYVIRSAEEKDGK